MKLPVAGALLAIHVINASCPDGAAAGILIDDYETGSITVSDSVGSIVEETQTGLDPNHVLGGERRIKLYGGDSQYLNLEAGQLTYQTGDDYGYFTVSYGSSTSPLNIDLIASGANAFVLDFKAPYFPLARVVVRSPTGADNPWIGNFDVTFSPNGMSRVIIPFDAYRSSDLRNVEEITLDVARVRSFSGVTFFRLATVPESSTACLLLATCLTSAAIRTERCSQT